MLSWQPIHREAAQRVLTYADRRPELAAVLRAMHGAGLMKQRIEDVAPDGARTPVETLDPFTFFAAFNRYIGDTLRGEMWTWLKARWDLAAPVPEEFRLPLANNFGWWFFPYAPRRTEADLDALWALAAAAFEHGPAALAPDLFERCLRIHNVGFAKLTMGLFWLNPDAYLSLDQHTRELLERHGVTVGKPSHAAYLAAVEATRVTLGGDFAAVSRRAYAEADAAAETAAAFTLTPAQMEMLWARFHARVPGFKTLSPDDVSGSDPNRARWRSRSSPTSAAPSPASPPISPARNSAPPLPPGRPWSSQNAPTPSPKTSPTSARGTPSSAPRKKAPPPSSPRCSTPRKSPTAAPAPSSPSSTRSKPSA